LDQVLLALASIITSTLVGILIRAHMLDVVVAVIHGWTWLITLPEPAHVRIELRSAIAEHVNQQKRHYLNDWKLGSAETAIRLLESQLKSMPGDLCVCAFATCRRLIAWVLRTAPMPAWGQVTNFDETWGAASDLEATRLAVGFVRVRGKDSSRGTLASRLLWFPPWSNDWKLIRTLHRRTHTWPRR